jgi:adenosyl cobinamide kinase/adenosyl cobinamide phosphate guanylyltransferase
MAAKLVSRRSKEGHSYVTQATVIDIELQQEVRHHLTARCHIKDLGWSTIVTE